MLLKDVVTAHLYGLLDKDIYKKVLEGFKMSEIRNSSLRETYQLHRSLYSLKQFGSMLYNHLSEYLLKMVTKTILSTYMFLV